MLMLQVRFPEKPSTRSSIEVILIKTHLAKRGAAGVLRISPNSPGSKPYEKEHKLSLFPEKNLRRNLCVEATIQILPGSGALFNNLTTPLFQSGLLKRLLKQKSLKNVQPSKKKLS